MTLTGFLVLQGTEDEADIRAGIVGRAWPGIPRAVAECEAKRRIIDLHSIDCWVGTGPDGDDEYFCAGCMGTGTAATPDGVVCPTLAALATVYADRPGYLDEWRRP